MATRPLLLFLVLTVMGALAADSSAQRAIEAGVAVGVILALAALAGAAAWFYYRQHPETPLPPCLTAMPCYGKNRDKARRHSIELEAETRSRKIEIEVSTTNRIGATGPRI